MLFISLCSLIRIHYQYEQYRNNQMFLNKPVTIVGTIEKINHATLTKKQTTIFIKTNSIIDKHQKLCTPQMIIVFCPTSTVTNLQPNQLITIEQIKLYQPKQHSDYERYLIKEGIWATTHCRGQAFKINKIYPLSFLQKIQQSIEQLDTTASTLFYPLFLGIKKKNNDILLLQHRSMYWGIAHHMARSGAHLAILFAFLILMLSYTYIPYFLRYSFCCSILIGYACISNLSISFLRSLIMILLHITCKAHNRLPSTLHILTLTTLGTLLHNPMQLFFLDFQLSFGITYIIVWLFNTKKNQTLAFNKSFLVRS